MAATPPSKGKDKIPFLVGPAGKRELRNELKATTNPAKTIQEFQESHSLHTMMAKALGTVPIKKYKNTRNTVGTVETLDSDSVMTFLSHLGVRQHEVHKRVSDALLHQLTEEIRKTAAEEPLLDLLKACWAYATTIPELRPVVWSVLKQLGPKTPLAVLIALTERDDDGSLKHSEVFQPLPASLKRLCWEADWDNQIPLDVNSEPLLYLEQVKTTVLLETFQPFIEQYTQNPLLQDAANRPFVATVSERRILTTQRRALTKSATTTTAALTTTTVAGSFTSHNNTLTSGTAVAHLRALLCDTSYRPKLLYATLSVLMAQHGTTPTCFLGGSEHLHCTLASDLLLSAGGPLPKAYTDVLALARTLDDVVQEANLSDANLVKIQAALKLIFQPDQIDTPAPITPAPAAGTPQPLTKAEPDAPTTSVKRQLNRLITTGLASMKETDPQMLFLNPVTDAIAPGYSKIISKPMSMVTMEQKVANNAYNSITDWETDVKLMFKNCIDYNRGTAGQWFRGEANRQAKVFREEIFPQARRLYQNEIAKRNVLMMDHDLSSGSSSKRPMNDGPEIIPLEPSTKKRKKEKEEYLPSMPALASMLLSDPFVVRIFLSRVLRDLQRGVVLGQSLPCAHTAVPSMLQILHVARWSKQICAVRGKKYIIPSAGLEEAEDPTAMVSFASLRRYLPLLLRLLLEAKLDNRVAPGGDLHQAEQSIVSLHSQPAFKWERNDQLQVAVALVEGALVHLCHPGNRSEASLSITFPKFSAALEQVSLSLLDDRPFFVCLTQALLRHKTKLPRSTRDAVVTSWLSWLRKEGSIRSAAHEFLVYLMNEWSALGNVLLPRDAMLRFFTDTVHAVDSLATSETLKFANTWKSNTQVFTPVKKQYERMLKQLPEASAKQWKEKHGIDDAEKGIDEQSPAEMEAGETEATE